ncbi:D-glycero-beta-D-manno-heptose 1,7-bisphosphate 7-phosphatase [Cyanobium sp. NS01]|uniref:D-glycero-alpha-D-manno-heptose-1,7-bisphosphate 7-phosphatase n=1 Tax=Cyanobium sp. NS01 TaxID=261284 RepID=UPI001645DE01|nr:HAD family hydrolase [Cyanobium sp. NS01]QNI71232.1 D-glycero-D-manno-heptose 1/7-bisphosphate phosphatase [Cyanobium sp. NS01]
MNRALFLDRDGVINEDYGYVHKIEDFHFREEIFDVCRAAQKARMKIVVVTNQAGIGRGYYSHEDFRRVTSYMLNRFCLLDITINRIYHCPFHPIHGVGAYKKDSFCRKPKPGMLVQACNELDLNPRSSIMIGNNDSDHAAAIATGILSYIDARQADWHIKAIGAIHEQNILGKSCFRYS